MKNEIYNDIINMQHHQSVKRPHMSMHDRAAQFGSFAALTGHKESIRETEIRNNIERVENEYEKIEEEKFENEEI